MAKQKYPWLRYVIILAIAVLLLVFVNLRNRRHEVKVTDIFSTNTEEVTAFTISKDTLTVTLLKADTTWVFAEPDTGVVKDWRINNFFSNVVEGSKTGFVTRNPEKHADYNVSEDLATKLELKHGESVLETIYVGRSKSSWSQDYIRYPDDPKVYISQKKLLSHLGERATFWR